MYMYMYHIHVHVRDIVYLIHLYINSSIQKLMLQVGVEPIVQYNVHVYMYHMHVHIHVIV